MSVVCHRRLIIAPSDCECDGRASAELTGQRAEQRHTQRSAGVMKVLGVFIFTCLLFQMASLKNGQTNPQPGLVQKPNVLENKTNPVLKENTTATLKPQKPPQPKPPKPPQPKPSQPKPQKPPQPKPQKPPQSKPEPQPKPTSKPPQPKIEPQPKTDLKPQTTKVPDEEFLGPAECLRQNYTRSSCSKVFCPPWRRCIAGQCVCKMAYKCPRQQINACTLDGSVYYSMCQANAIACRSNKPTFSHFGQTCKAEEMVKVEVSNPDHVVEIKTRFGKKLVCGKDWNMAAANVVCRGSLGVDRGADRASKITYESLDKTITWPNECMRVRCMGSELSLAECTIYNPEPISGTAEVAVSKCYNEPTGQCKKFVCANGKCLRHGRPCNGIDDCGDNSDEMCCQSCRDGGFHCKSGVCIPQHAVRDGIRDCLGGEDELGEPGQKKEKTEDLFSDPKSEIKVIRQSTEDQLQCGVPNMEYVYKQEEDAPRSRRKRLVGGQEALPTQIQWQVAIQDEGSIHCGGVYLGGCWVLTAAHCVRPKPKSFRVKFSLWRKLRRQTTTDSIPVKSIIIHEDYNAQTYANDIALVRLEEMNLSDKCIHDNPAVRAVCVPWSTQQFQPNDTCTISGWGRNKEGMSALILKWANVTIISDCQNYYKNRFLPGMECAGDLEGKVDSCQGDSGGPLVCKDASGLSYVWGIVSWGDKCGEPNYPGVYTKVAHYFDWIRFHTGWPAVTKFNQ